MKLRYKIILLVPVVLLGLIFAFFVFCILSFHIMYRIYTMNTPPPGYLTNDEISIIETSFGVTFPVSSAQINTYFNNDNTASLYCFVEFDQKDLEDFKSGHQWISVKEGSSKVSLIVVRSSIPPLRMTVSFFGGIPVPIKWWDVSKDRVRWVSSKPPPNDSGGHIDILLETAPDERVRAYMVCAAMRRTFPPAIFDIFLKDKIGWDLRESKLYPKKITARPELQPAL